MEARFNEKVREYQDVIAGADPRDVPALEMEMFEYMARTAPFIREYHQEAKTESVTKTVGNIKITSQKGIQRQDIYNSYLAEVEGVPPPVNPRAGLKYFTACQNCGANYSLIFDEVLSEDVCIECGMGEHSAGRRGGLQGGARHGGTSWSTRTSGRITLTRGPVNFRPKSPRASHPTSSTSSGLDLKNKKLKIFLILLLTSSRLF